MPSLAAIDVGSHAIRLSMVELSSVGSVTNTTFERWPIRLGADAFGHGKIRGERMQVVLGVFEEIAGRLREHRVDAYRAVATSAVRDSKNGGSLVRAIHRATGVGLEIISGAEEGRMARDALMRALGTVPADTLLIDLGGGSLELHRAGGRLARSLPLGTVRIVERFPELSKRASQRQLGQIAGEIQAELSRKVPAARMKLAIGTGGNLNALARLVPSKTATYPAIDIRRLGPAIRRLAALSPRQRITRLGLRPDRVDVIVPAALVILAVARHFGLRSCVVPGTGLRETILRTLADQMLQPVKLDLVLGRLGQRGRKPVVRLALQLFELLRPIHGLWAPARVPLQVAAHLKEAGALIDPGRASHHTAYIIENLADLDLDQRSREVAAAATVPAGEALTWQTLCAADQKAAATLGALITLAEKAIERGVKKIEVNLTAEPATVCAGLRGVRTDLGKILGIPLRVR